MKTTILYIYQAALYCQACGERIRADLTAQGKAPEDPDDLESYDSDEFPKDALAGETDSPSFCDSGADCADPIVLSDGQTKIGCYLEEDLTEDGIRNLQQSLARVDLDPVLRRIYKDVADAHGVKFLPHALRVLLRADGTLPAFSSVGCYTILYYDDKGNTFCAECAVDPDNEAQHAEPYYEGPIVFCDGCNKEIESSYGDPDADEQESEAATDQILR